MKTLTLIFITAFIIGTVHFLTGLISGNDEMFFIGIGLVMNGSGILCIMLMLEKLNERIK